MATTLLSITASTTPADSEGVRATITLPASKSISNRLLIMQALSGNEISIDNLSTADDTGLLAAALTTKSGEINLGNAGTALRFATAWAAITPGDRILTGSKRLCDRPLKPLIDTLRKCGADITCLEREGHAPIRISGKQLSGGDLHIDGTESSQFLSAILLVAPYFDGTTRITLDPAQVSLPYIQMTLTLMERAGADIQFPEALNPETDADDQSRSTITIHPGTYTEASFTVEPDWSAASYFYLFTLFMPESSILLEGLTAKSVQGDKIIRKLFSALGVHTEFTNRGARLQNRNISATNDRSDAAQTKPKSSGGGDYIIPESGIINCLTFPDLAQTLAVAACGLNTPLRLTGLQTLRLKETDRIAALATELHKCGIHCQTGADFIEILPATEATARFHPSDLVQSEDHPVPPPQISTYSDHRMAMSFAPLAAVFGEIIIEDPEVVSKSFPNFWQEVKKLGFTLHKYHE